MPISSMRGMPLHELCALYGAEHGFVEGQQEMAHEAADGYLESTMREHLAHIGPHARKHKRR